MSHERKLMARLAYEAYMKSLGMLDEGYEFMNLPEDRREAWANAGQAVAEEFKRKTQDVFYGYTSI